MFVRKKIVFLVPSMRAGGSERVINTIINYIDNSVFEPILVLLQKEGEYLDDLPSDLKIINLDVSKARYSIFKIIRTIYRLKPDISISTLGYINILLALLRPFLPKNIKFIARESSIVSINNKSEKYENILNYLYKIVYNRFDTIIAQSNYMRDDLVNNYKIDENKIKVINNPLDIDKITTKSKTGEKLFSDDNINLLAVGRLNTVKGYDTLLESLCKLDKRYHLTILGDGQEKAKLLELVQTLGAEDRVHFLGFQKNPYKYMKQADLFILSSRYEGFPNVVLEANACGLPVVAFECPGGIGEIIKHGTNGFLVECGNVKKLKKSIEKANYYDWDTKKIIFDTQKKFMATTIVKKYEKVFNAPI